MSFNFMATVTIHSDFGAQEGKNLSLFPFPGHLPDPGIESRSPALQADSLSTELKKAESLRIGAFEL